jgi:hypothetical protein
VAKGPQNGPNLGDFVGVRGGEKEQHGGEPATNVSDCQSGVSTQAERQRVSSRPTDVHRPGTGVSTRAEFMRFESRCFGS